MSKKLTSSFIRKIKNGERTVMYELLPLPKSLTKEDIRRSLSLFSAMIAHYPVDIINIPEVMEETRGGKREATIAKLEPRILCGYLQKYTDSEVVINRPIVYLPWEKQKRWLNETQNHFGIHNFILVGGESSKVTYPGPSVIEAAKQITTLFPQIVLGGIVIPTRQREGRRVLQKSLSGVTFFTSQIIYESRPVKKFLKDYWKLCQKAETKPTMIFLSFAPLTTPADLALINWLGVRVPKKTQEMLTNSWLGLGSRSLQVCQDIFEDILEFVEKERIRVPLGLNIEHLNRHNFETSFMLLERLSGIYAKSTVAERRQALYV